MRCHGLSGQRRSKICGVFSATAPLLRSSASSLGWQYIRSAIFSADNTHAYCAYAKFRAMWVLHAVSSPRVLALRSFWGWRVLVRVVYTAGYRFARDAIRDCSHAIADSAQYRPVRRGVHCKTLFGNVSAKSAPGAIFWRHNNSKCTPLTATLHALEKILASCPPSISMRALR